ncbi:hypothetical protein MLD38_003159 [Melastoma candidum]|uniref:Uncharacterized protein n=1 Tax=Melastoma candidum TaxID=119954 RepID=A0ACB9S654_9MYRT|nr:hypothetical protein MLD38_003159 [Melastoma candidum]
MAFVVIAPPGGTRPGGQRHKSALQTLFAVESKYTPIKMIGRGSYGLVCSATDIATGDKVAIKKIQTTTGNCELKIEASPMVIDLLERMLVLDPSGRLTVTEALNHPFLAGLYDPSTKVAAQSTESLKAFNRMDEFTLRQMMRNEMSLYNITYFTPCLVEWYLVGI